MFRPLQHVPLIIFYKPEPSVCDEIRNKEVCSCQENFSKQNCTTTKKSYSINKASSEKYSHLAVFDFLNWRVFLLNFKGLFFPLHT